jgi:hypothetical protein
MVMGILDKLAYPVTPSDGVLFHYTSLQGLFGMARTRSMWATHYRFLNDSGEFMFGLELLEAAVQQRLEKATDEDKRKLDQFANFLERGSFKAIPVFVVSFTSDGNLLSQWRAYTPSESGVSVGFRTSALAASAEKQGFTLVKCGYRDIEHAAIIDRVIALALAGSPDSHTATEYEFWPHFAKHYPDFVAYLLQIKHSAFSEEQECRLIAGSPRGIQHRVGRTAVIPYVEFALPTLGPRPESKSEEFERSLGILTPEADWLDVEQIFQGPSPFNSEFTAFSMWGALQANKVSVQKSIEDSGVPYVSGRR